MAADHQADDLWRALLHSGGFPGDCDRFVHAGVSGGEPAVRTAHGIRVGSALRGGLQVLLPENRLLEKS